MARRKVGINGDHAKSGSSKGINCHLDDKGRGSETGKKIRRSRSIKLSEVEEFNPSSSERQGCRPRIVSSPSYKGLDESRDSMVSANGSPNYMKSTTSFEARKGRSPLVVSNLKGASEGKHKGRGGVKQAYSSSDKPAKKLIRSSSLKLGKTLKKSYSFKVVRVTAKRCSRFVLREDGKTPRATCSSTLKDVKFPPYLELHPGGKEAEGTSVFKVCPYKYCSLNGHYHTLVPPLKYFIRARRYAMRSAGLQSEITRPTRGQPDCRQLPESGATSKTMDFTDPFASPNDRESRLHFAAQIHENETAGSSEERVGHNEGEACPYSLDPVGDCDEEDGCEENLDANDSCSTGKSLEEEEVAVSDEEEEAVSSDDEGGTNLYQSQREGQSDGECIEPIEIISPELNVLPVRSSGKHDEVPAPLNTVSCDSSLKWENDRVLMDESPELLCLPKPDPGLKQSGEEALPPMMTTENSLDESRENFEVVEEGFPGYDAEMPEDLNEARSSPECDQCNSADSSETEFDVESAGSVDDQNLTGEDVEDDDLTGPTSLRLEEDTGLKMEDMSIVVDGITTDEKTDSNDLRDSENVKLSKDLAHLNELKRLDVDAVDSADSSTSDEKTDFHCLEITEDMEVSNATHVGEQNWLQIDEINLANEKINCDGLGDDEAVELPTTKLTDEQNQVEVDVMQLTTEYITSDRKEEPDDLEHIEEGKLRNITHLDDNYPSDSFAANQKKDLDDSEEVHLRNLAHLDENSPSDKFSADQMTDFDHSEDNEDVKMRNSTHLYEDKPPDSIAVNQKTDFDDSEGTEEVKLRNSSNVDAPNRLKIDDTKLGTESFMLESSLKTREEINSKSDIRFLHERRESDVNDERSHSRRWSIGRGSRPKSLEDEKDYHQREPNFLPAVPDPETEKVDLKHQEMEDRRNADEWMIDHALQQAVSKLASVRKKKVELMVEAFETVLPVQDHKSSDSHSSSSLSSRPIQALG